MPRAKRRSRSWDFNAVLAHVYGDAASFDNKTRFIRLKEHGTTDKLTKRYVALVEKGDSRYEDVDDIEVWQADSLRKLATDVAAACDVIVDDGGEPRVRAVFDFRKKQRLVADIVLKHKVTFSDWDGRIDV